MQLAAQWMAPRDHISSSKSVRRKNLAAKLVDVAIEVPTENTASDSIAGRNADALTLCFAFAANDELPTNLCARVSLVPRTFKSSPAFRVLGTRAHHPSHQSLIGLQIDLANFRCQ